MTDVIRIDHIYLTVSDLDRSARFYDLALCRVLGFRKNSFTLAGDRHIQYFNRQFGFVLRPARSGAQHDPYAPGLHHFCLRVEAASDVDVLAVGASLRALDIDATKTTLFPQYTPDYWATFFTDQDGIRLEVTNYRQERRQRHDHWDDAPEHITTPTSDPTHGLRQACSAIPAMLSASAAAPACELKTDRRTTRARRYYRR